MTHIEVENAIAKEQTMVFVVVILIAIVSALTLLPAFAPEAVILHESLQNEAAADTGVANVAGTGDLHHLHRYLLHRRHHLARHHQTRLHLHHRRPHPRRQRTVVDVVVGTVVSARDLADAETDAIGAEMTAVMGETKIVMVEAKL